MPFQYSNPSGPSGQSLGDVMLSNPLPWRIVTFLFVFIAIAAIAFLFLGKYQRIELAKGTIVFDKGISSIVPFRAGLLIEIPVKEGQKVYKGMILAKFQVEQYTSDILSPIEQKELALNEQFKRLEALKFEQEKISSHEISANKSLQLELASEIDLIKGQIDSQQKIVESSEELMNRISALAEKKLISKHELQIKTDELLRRKQELLQLKQQLSVRSYELKRSRELEEQLLAESRKDVVEVDLNRLNVRQQLSDVELSRSYVIRSPRDGIVTGIVAKEGQYLTPNDLLMNVIPVDAMLQAEIAIPSASIAFVSVGQKVGLAVDAFPYQRYGIIMGEIINVSESTIDQRQTSSSTTAPYYLAIVRPDSTSMNAYGTEISLRPGMTLIARIRTKPRSLFEWLFDPVFAVANR